MSNILNGTVQTNGLGYVKANIDGVEFNKIRGISNTLPTGSPVSPASARNLWTNGTSSLSTWKGTNSVDIDWNGAVLPNANLTTGGSVTINTTGELLKLINDMQQEIYTLSAAVIAIGSKV